MMCVLGSNGRNDEIWTHDPYHPKVVRYQAALRPDLTPTYYYITHD